MNPIDRDELAKQLSLLASFAGELSNLAASVRDRCNRGYQHLQRDLPVATLSMPGTSDMPALVARIVRADGRIEAMVAHVYALEETEAREAV